LSCASKTEKGLPLVGVRGRGRWFRVGVPICAQALWQGTRLKGEFSKMLLIKNSIYFSQIHTMTMHIKSELKCLNVQIP
jgi:hypothetical protein